MKIINSQISDALLRIKYGEPFVYPTETVWGVGCICSQTSSIHKIFEIKGRSQQNAVSLLVKDVVGAEVFAELNQKTRRFLSIVWPGAVTVVLPAKSEVSEAIHRGTHYVGLRCSPSRFITRLLEEVGESIVTTSANSSGNPSIVLREDALKWSKLKELLIIEPPHVGIEAVEDIELLQGVPSTVVKVDCSNNISLLRQGEVPFSELEMIFNQVIK